MSSDTQAPRQISRRAIVGAAVWATPVVAVVTATPALATSPGSANDPALSIKEILNSGLWGGNGQNIQGNFTVNLTTTVPGDQRLAVITATAKLYKQDGGSWVEAGTVPVKFSHSNAGSNTVLFSGGSVTYNLDGGPILTGGTTYRVEVNVVVTEIDGSTVLTQSFVFASITAWG